MSNITSTLSIRVNDDGFASKLQADAEAARRLGLSAKDLGKLRATAGTAGLVKQFDKLGATAKQLDTFQGASKNLNSLGSGLRNARTEAARAAQALAQAQKRVDFFDRSKANNSPNYGAFKASGLVDEARSGLRAAARAHTAAKRTLANTEAAFREQRTAVDTMARSLDRAGHPVANLARTQADLQRRMDQASAAIRRQATAHEQARVAAVASRAETERNATAQLRATVHGANGVRAEREARRAAASAEARQTNSTALRRTIEAGRQARADREASAGAETRRRATAGRDMAAGMGTSGRRQAADIEGGRRVADGMSRPARDARARAQAEAEAAEAERQERREGRRTARTALAGVAGVAIGHKVKEGTEATLHTYRDYDKERRFGQVVMGLSDADQKPLVDQAIHLGATSKFNDVKVLEAQRELSARGLTGDQVLGMIPAAKDLGQATDLPIADAVKQIEGGIFGFKKDISTKAAAEASARQTADIQTAAAKASGMTPEDIRQAYTYGATPARLAGVSEQKMLAFGAIGKKSNMDGAQMGTAWRALISSATAPTRKAKETMRANGLNYSDYQKAPDSLNLDGFVGNVASSYGVRLNEVAKQKLGAIFTDKDLIADASKFTPAVMDALGASLGKKDAKSKQSIAGMANRYRDGSMQGVDVDRLIGDLLQKIPGNIAFSNALFGSKQGSRIASAYGDPETYKKILDILVNHSEGKAATVSGARMAGYDGAQSMYEGSKTNLESAIGRAIDNGGNGEGGLLTTITRFNARLLQSMAELPDPVLATGAGAAWLGGKAATVGGTAALTGTAFGVVNGIGTGAFTAGAAALTTAVLALPAALAAAAATALTMTYDQAKKIATKDGAQAFIGKADAGEAAALNPMEGLAPKDPPVQKYLRTRFPGVFGNWEGSLPPGTAGMPAPAPARLPGLDGRVGPRPSEAPKPEIFVRQPGFGNATPKIPPMATQRPETANAAPAGQAPVPDAGKVQEATAALASYKAELESVKSELAASASLDLPGVGAGLEARKAELEHMIEGVKTQLSSLNSETVAPKVETSAIESLHVRADKLKEALQAAGGVTVAPQASPAGLSGTLAVAKELLETLRAIPGAISASNGALSRASVGGSLQGRSRSFSDGVTPGAGAE